MTTINPFFTLNYAQPEEYHFSHDSVFLARNVFERLIAEKINYTTALDLCSGCGIIGIDLMFHLQKNNFSLPKKFDFLEVQNIYKPYFEKNIESFYAASGQSINHEFINLNYDQINIYENSLHNKYDLIVCNPPYFRKGQGVLSKSEFKNRCRFFIDSDFTNLVRSIEYALSPTGIGYVLLKSLEEHGVSIEKEFLKLTSTLNLKKIDLIRDTDLYELRKK